VKGKVVCQSNLVYIHGLVFGLEALMRMTGI
jgi:hypothetical protein